MVRSFDLNVPSLEEQPSKRKKTGKSSSENEGRLDNSRSNDGLLLEGETGFVSDPTILSFPIELESNGSSEDNHVSSENGGRLEYSISIEDIFSPDLYQSLPSFRELLSDLVDILYGSEPENNGSPDREDNHVSSENGGRLDNSRSNVDCEIIDILSPNFSVQNTQNYLDREDNHLSSKNEGRLHYSRSNDDLWMKLNNLPGGGIGTRIGKILVSNTEIIAKGSNGTIVFEGFHELRPVAVKRLVRGLHDDVVFNEIKNLIESDRHPNIVRYYGVENDQYFVYLALERCACSLDDLIQAHSESSNNSVFPNDPASMVGYKSKLDSVRDAMQDVKLWRPDGHPSPFFLKLMRDVVSGLASLHVLGIIHRDLKPQNVLISKNPSLGAQLCDMGISRRLPQDKSSLGYHATGCGTSGWLAPEQLRRGRQTCAMDMFSLGCVLFFCVTSGRHPFGECLERDINIMKNKMDLSLVESIPEVHHLISLLLNPDLESRPKSLEVLHHPFFWNSEMRLSFLRDTSDRVLLEVASAPNSDLLNELESKAPLIFAGHWDNKIEPIFMADIRRRRYDYSCVRDLLRAVRNKWAHYIELSEEVKELIGRDPEGYDNFFAERFPRLLMLSYEVVSQFCKKEECFRKYFGSVDAI